MIDETPPYPFTLSALEREKITKFVERHRQKHYLKKTAIFSLRFTPTGIGTAVEVVCSCKKKQNVTDYENW